MIFKVNRIEIIGQYDSTGQMLATFNLSTCDYTGTAPSFPCREDGFINIIRPKDAYTIGEEIEITGL